MTSELVISMTFRIRPMQNDVRDESEAHDRAFSMPHYGNLLTTALALNSIALVLFDDDVPV